MSTSAHETLRAWLACPDCGSQDVHVEHPGPDRLVFACNECGYVSGDLELP